MSCSIFSTMRSWKWGWKRYNEPSTATETSGLSILFRRVATPTKWGEKGGLSQSWSSLHLSKISEGWFLSQPIAVFLSLTNRCQEGGSRGHQRADILRDSTVLVWVLLQSQLLKHLFGVLKVIIYITVEKNKLFSSWFNAKSDKKIDFIWWQMHSWFAGKLTFQFLKHIWCRSVLWWIIPLIPFRWTKVHAFWVSPRLIWQFPPCTFQRSFFHTCKSDLQIYVLW